MTTESAPTFESPAQALADVWASIDGKLEQFRLGRSGLDEGGFYGGYMAEAEDAVVRLRARGFDIVLLGPATPVNTNGLP